MREVKLRDGGAEVVGAAYLDGGVAPRRLPRHCEPLLDMMTMMASQSPSGVRVVLRTDSPVVELEMTPTVLVLEATGLTDTSAPVDLVIDGQLVSTQRREGGHRIVVGTGGPSDVVFHEGGPVHYRFDDLGVGDKTIELWLPTVGSVTLGSLSVADDAGVTAVADSRPRWIHYGSSISQCGEAHSPGRAWPAAVAREADLHLTSLGLGGSCHLDQYVARHIRDLPADVITMKVGINIMNRASLNRRTFVPNVHGFLDTVRDGHPDVPVVLASPIFSPSGEERPGPSVLAENGRYEATGDPDDESALSLEAMRSLLAEVVELRKRQGDRHLHHLDGLQLFGRDDQHFLPDGLHPNGDGYELIAERFGERVFGANGLVPDVGRLGR